MKRLRMLLALGPLAAALIAGPGCDDVPAGPTAVATPSPSPTPTGSPSPDPRCIPSYCEIHGDGIVFGIGPKQERTLRLLVLDSFRTPIDNKCEYPRSIVWSHDGPIEPVGSRNGSAFTYYAVAPGRANVYVEVGERANCRFSITIEP